MLISGSIVIYQHTYSEISALLDKLERSNINLIYVVDNSPSNIIQNKLFLFHPNVVYIHEPSNPGFGAAHNIALRHAVNNNSQYHFVINPDVLIDEIIVDDMVDYMDNNDSVGMIMPEILNHDGSIQFLPKLLPSPISVVLRVFNKKFGVFESFVRKYELRDVNVDMTYDAPILSGCFTLFRISSLVQIGFYDDRYFMYFEDWDLSRRMQEKFRTVYFAKSSVIHGYESGANRSSRLFKIFVKSYILYFNKWGWFFDRDRHKINERVLKQFK